MKKQSPTIYIDGKYLKVAPEVIEAFTPGVFKGNGVFETMLSVGEKVLDLELHLRRLHKALKKAHVSASIVRRVVCANQLGLARVRILAWQEGKQVHVAVMALKYVLSKAKTFHVCIVKTDRKANAKAAYRKSLDYALFADAFYQAQALGYDEALLLNAKGNIFESSRANIFWVEKGKLFTPPLSSGCLAGITRQQVIDEAHRLKNPVCEKTLTLDILKQADTAFLTNSLIGIVPLSLKKARR